MKISVEKMELAGEIGGALMKQDMQEISELIIHHSDDHFKELAKKLDELFLEFAQKQRQGEAGPVNYVNFTYLYSSILTESFDILIYLSDSCQFEGVNGVHTTWKPMFIMDY